MKPVHLGLGAALLLVVLLLVMWWRQSELTDEISALRASLLNQARASEAKPAQEPRTENAHSAFENTPALAETREPEGAEERIAALEKVVNAQADLLEELYGKLSEMELSQKKAAAPAWNALQAVGAPDSGPGDQRTAWAPATMDGGEEWLEVEFAKAVEPATVIVRENSAPGAIVRIAAVDEGGREVMLWQGDAPKVFEVSNTPFAASQAVLTSKVKIYLDTRKVPGWNEIDAVQVIGRDGTRQWARSAHASSSYGSGSGLNISGTAPLHLELQEGSNVQNRGSVEFEGFVNSGTRK